MNKFFLTILLLLAGCTSLSQKVFENIHEGDSKQHLIDVLGAPDQFGESQKVQGGTAYYYLRKGETCGFAIKDDVIKFMTCVKGANYRSGSQRAADATAAFLQGMSNGARSQSSCTSMVNGNMIQTNCH